MAQQLKPHHELCIYKCCCSTTEPGHKHCSRHRQTHRPTA